MVTDASETAMPAPPACAGPLDTAMETRFPETVDRRTVSAPCSVVQMPPPRAALGLACVVRATLSTTDESVTWTTAPPRPRTPPPHTCAPAGPPVDTLPLTIT